MTKSISLFAIRHQLSNLVYLNLDRLDLTREHRWLCRAPLFLSVQRLKLFDLQKCQLSQIVLFVNSFPSLTRLDIYFDFTKLEHTGQILPKPFRNNTRSLKWLDVQLIPGSSRLIEWLFKAKSLSSQLTTLILYVDDMLISYRKFTKNSALKSKMKRDRQGESLSSCKHTCMHVCTHTCTRVYIRKEAEIFFFFFTNTQ